MPKNINTLKRFNALNYALALVTFSGLLMRLIAPLTTRALPFFDSSGYYQSVVTMQTQHIDPWLNYQTRQFTAELPMENFVIYLLSSYTGIDAFDASKYLPPSLLTLIMVPGIALIATKVSGRRDIGLLAALLFSISDVGSLRESYPLAEGIAVAVAIIYVICLIRAVESRSIRWILLSGFLMLGVFSAHNLTPFMFFMITIGVSLFMLKNRLIKLAYWIATIPTFAALFTSFSPLHYNLDHNPYTRYSILLTEVFSHERAIASGKQFSNPIASYTPSQPITYFMFLHMITVFTLLVALPFFALYLIRKPRTVSVAIAEVWLILAGATFIVGLTGDSLFGSDNPFFGYRTWIYLMMPAAIGAAYTLMYLIKLPHKQKVVLFSLVAFVLIVSVPATVAFIRQINSQYEEVNAHDYDMSVWLEQHVHQGNYTVYSTDAFYGAANSTLISDQSELYFFGNISTIFSNETYYVVLSYTTIEYPYHNQGLTVPLDHFYNPYFDRVYSAQTDWVFVYNPSINNPQILGLNKTV